MQSSQAQPADTVAIQHFAHKLKDFYVVALKQEGQYHDVSSRQGLQAELCPMQSSSSCTATHQAHAQQASQELHGLTPITKWYSVLLCRQAYVPRLQSRPGCRRLTPVYPAATGPALLPLLPKWQSAQQV